MRLIFIKGLLICSVAMIGACGDDSSSLPGKDGGADTSFKDSQLQDAPSCTSEAARSCIEGVTFVACGAGGAPAIFCSSGEAGRCVWISDGCPVGDYIHRVGPACSCEESTCPPSIPAFIYSFGTDPWTRDSPAMNVAVAVDPNENAAENDVVICQGTGATDCSKPTICCAATTGPGAGPVVRWTLKELRDTFALHIGAKWVFAGWQLMIEVDHRATPPRARVCRIPFTDSQHCGNIGADRECASSGQITLTSGTPTETTLTALRGTFSATFPSGLEITGSFH